MTEFLKDIIKGPMIEKDKNGKLIPWDMVEKGILDPNWKMEPKAPTFTNCNIINFKIPPGVKIENCCIIPVDEESFKNSKE